ncbi:porin family protein [Roseateles sp. NT4]|uniref:porin family protein n=1 Tax=Roseateles sp. NT4 TaxID=3453715 RepID=UPI003EEB7359
MNRIPFTATPLLCMLAVSSAWAGNIDNTQESGPYIGAALGRTSFSAKNLGLPKTGSDESAQASKVYGGYRFSNLVGVEGGYVRLGNAVETLTVGNNAVSQTVKARSLYVAATSRLPLSDAFALTGKAGVSFGKASGANLLPASSDMTGSKRSFMWGIGAEYQLTNALALTADFDHFGQVSEKVRANLFSAGVRYRF